jgi:hypothetical protein
LLLVLPFPGSVMPPMSFQAELKGKPYNVHLSSLGNSFGGLMGAIRRGHLPCVNAMDEWIEFLGGAPTVLSACKLEEWRVKGTGD